MLPHTQSLTIPDGSAVYDRVPSRAVSLSVNVASDVRRVSDPRLRERERSPEFHTYSSLGLELVLFGEPRSCATAAGSVSSCGRPVGAGSRMEA